MKKILIVILFLIIVSNNIYGQTNRALITGISYYKNLSFSNEIQYSVDDAELIYKSFVQSNLVSPDNILYYTDEEVTKFNIILGLYTLIDASESGDNVFFYFSGYIDVNSSVDSSGYLLCHNVTSEGFYPTSDAVRIEQLKQMSIYAKENGVNLVFLYDIFSNSGLPGGYEGANKTIKYLKEPWEGTVKLLSKDSQQFGISANNTKNNFFALNISIAVEDEKNYTEYALNLKNFNNLIATNVLRESKHQQSPIESGEYNFKILKNKESNKLPFFKPYYNIPALYASKIRSFYKKIKEYNFYSVIEKPELLFDKVEESDFCGVNCIVFGLSSTIATAHSNGDVNFYSLDQNSTFIKKISPHKGRGITYLEEYNDDIIITGSLDDKINIINYKENRVLAEFKAHRNDIDIVKLSKNKDFIITAGRDSYIKIWGIDENFKITEKQSFTTNGDIIKYIEFYNNNIFISGGKRGKIIFWKINDDKVIKLETIDIKAEITGIEVYKNKVFVSDANGFLTTIDIQNYSILQKQQIFNNITAIEKTNYDDFNNYLFVASNKKIHIISLDNLNFKMDEIKTSTNINSLFYTNNNKLVAFANSKKSSILSFSKPQPKTDNLSAYYYYYLFLKATDIDEFNKSKFLMEYTSAMLLYIDNIVNAFISGSYIYPTNDEVKNALFFLDLIQQKLSDKELIIKHIEIQKLVLKGYDALLSENFENMNQSLSKLDTLKSIIPYATFPYTQISQINTEINNLTIAEQNIAIASQRMPKWSETMVRKGNILLKKGEFEQAIAEYKKIIKEAPDNSKGYVLVAQTFIIENMLDSANVYIDIAYKKDPQNIYILNQKAMLLMKTMEFSEAEALLKTAISFNSNYRISKINKGILTKTKHDFISSDKIYNNLLYDTTFSAPYYLMANMLLNVGNLAEAEKIITKGYKLFPDNSEIILAYANFFSFKFFKIQADFNLAQKAMFYYDMAITKSPFYFKPYFQKAQFLINILKYRKEKLISDDLLIIPSQKNTIEIYKDSIISNLNMAIKFSPNNLEIKYEFARLYALTGKKDSVNRIYEYFLNLSNQTTGLYYGGLTMELLNNDKIAQKHYEKALKKNPNYIPALDKLLLLFLKNNEIKAFNKLKKKNNWIKKSVVFVYYDETLIGINSSKKGYAKSANMFKKFYYSKIAKSNLKFIDNQSKNTDDNNWGFKRIKIIEDKWIIVEYNSLKGLMFFNGQLLIPMNFDKISYEQENIFKCTKGNKSYLIEVNAISAKFLKEI